MPDSVLVNDSQLAGRDMLGRRERDQLELFITGSLRQFIPDEHVLARVDRVLDLSWLRGEVSDCYCLDDGRPGIDPEVAIRLMLAGLLIGIVHDRKLMREAEVNIPIRWFIGYGLHEKLPHHSSLTRIRQRWGEERFRKIFKRTVESCLKANIATGEIVHIDSSLIRANVSWDSLVERHVADVLSENQTEEETEVERKSRQSGKYKKVCTTDPDATMATNARNRRLEPAYKQHAAVDDKVGVILDVAVTTGQTNEGEMIEPQVDEVKATTGIDIKTVTADAGYAYAKVYGALERRDIDALIPTKAEPIRSPVPLRRFRYDAKNDIVKCPRGKVLRPGNPVGHGQLCRQRMAPQGSCPVASTGEAVTKGQGILPGGQRDFEINPMDQSEATRLQRLRQAPRCATKRTRRRRHDYSPEIADLICDRIAGGASLRQICQDATMPARSTIFVWLEEHEDFARSYALARQIQIEDLMDEILEIADDSSNDWIDREGPDGKKYRVFNPDSIRRSKLRIAARKWLISKLMPKRYGWK